MRCPVAADRFQMPWSSAASRKPAEGDEHAAPRGAHDGDREAEPDPGEGGEERVRERTHDAAQDEQLGEALLAVLHVLAAQVEDVLAEGEPGADQTGIHDAVDHAVELAPPQQDDEQHAEPLEALLDEWRPEHRGDDVRVLRAGQPHGDRDAGVEEERPCGCADRTPGERQHQHQRRLGLVAVQPEERRDDDEERQGREQRRQQGDLDAEPGLELHRQHRGTEEEPGGDEPADDDRAQSWP